MYLTAFNFHR